jgi:hypothetical protein
VDVRHPGDVGERCGADGDGHGGLSARWDRAARGFTLCVSKGSHYITTNN